MSILFCTPCYGGQVTEPHFRSCLNLKHDLTVSGLKHDWLTGRNESLITRARNEMTKSFLESDYDYMMWLDADIEFTTDDVGKLWNLVPDIAVGFYSMKLPAKPLSAWKDGKLVRLKDCPQEPFEVDYAGTGFMMIARKVIETLAEDAEPYEGPNGVVRALYQTPIHNFGFESEDYYFCRKATDAGFKIIGDPSIKLTHWGQYGFGN